MRLKQKLSATLAVLLIMLHGFPAFAIASDDLQEQAETVTIQDSDTSSEPPMFSAELVEGGENPGLYGTLSHIPENAMDITVEYSFGGESYYFVNDVFWEMDEDSPDASPLPRRLYIWRAGIK